MESTLHCIANTTSLWLRQYYDNDFDDVDDDDNDNDKKL